MVRKLKYHEGKLLRKLDFINWKQARSPPLRSHSYPAGCVPPEFARPQL